ncbi:hypothetical protein U9M48_017132 [Paspalum notatum var. saurae]|uniref:Ubiquitin-like domain-containing protein n=1 Tax=Paspalum notatum var. saurae TaxID=547442 RepID=A0AAQ3T6X7_PASNO
MSTPPAAKLGQGEVTEEMSAATKPVKVESSGGDDGALINIKVQSQTAADVFFRIKRDVKLRRLMDMYCGRHSLSPKAVQFLDTEGRQIRPAQMADEVGLQDGDAIDVMIHMEGGGGAPAGGEHESRGFSGLIDRPFTP